MTTTITVQTADHAVEATFVEGDTETEVTFEAHSTNTVYIYKGKAVAFEEIHDEEVVDQTDAENSTEN